MISRRAFFRTFTAIFALSLFSRSRMEAAGMEKKIAKYQENPKNGEQCSKCVYFDSKNRSCQVVEGDISPQGWCRLFAPIKSQ